MMGVIEAQQFIWGTAVRSSRRRSPRLSHAKDTGGLRASGTRRAPTAAKALNLRPGDEVITTPF